MEEKKRDVVDELMGVLDSMSECAGKMIDATKVMIRLLSSGRLQLCDDAGENLTEEEPVVEEQQEPEAEVPCTFEEVRGIMASLSGKGKKAEARELLQKFGAKVVEGRSNRKYTDEDAVARTVTEAGYDPYEKKILGITAMSSLLGKKRFEELLGSLIYKPPGKPALVPETDPRPAMDTAAEDFKDKTDMEEK